MQMHHVAIILPTEEQVHAYMQQYGLEVDREGETPYNAKCIFTKAKPGESPIEFLIPHGGVLKEFNGGKGGIHHVCYKVDNIDEATRQLRAQGCDMLEPEAIAASEEGDTTFRNVKINFVRPRSSQGVLVELWQEDDA